MQSDEYFKEHLEQSLKVAQAGVEEEVFIKDDGKKRGDRLKK